MDFEALNWGPHEFTTSIITPWYIIPSPKYFMYNEMHPFLVKSSVILTNIETVCQPQQWRRHVQVLSHTGVLTFSSMLSNYLWVILRNLPGRWHYWLCVMGITSDIFRILHQLKSVRSFVPCFCWVHYALLTLYLYSMLVSIPRVSHWCCLFCPVSSAWMDTWVISSLGLLWRKLYVSMFHFPW